MTSPLLLRKLVDNMNVRAGAIGDQPRRNPRPFQSTWHVQYNIFPGAQGQQPQKYLSHGHKNVKGLMTGTSPTTQRQQPTRTSPPGNGAAQPSAPADSPRHYDTLPFDFQISTCNACAVRGTDQRKTHCLKRCLFCTSNTFVRVFP